MYRYRGTVPVRNSLTLTKKYGTHQFVADEDVAGVLLSTLLFSDKTKQISYKLFAVFRIHIHWIRIQLKIWIRIQAIF